MRQKIATALKTRYANLGLNDTAFDGVAGILEKTITNESDIDSATSADYVSSLLKGMQSEFDKLRGEKSTALKALDDYKKAHPETTPPTDPPQDSELATLIREMKAKMDAMEQKSLETEKKAKTETLMAEVRRKMKESGSDNDFILNLALANAQVGDADTADTLAAKFKAVYDDTYKQAYGDGKPKPAAGIKKTEGYKAGDFKDQVEMLKREGMLPNNKS